MLKQLEGKRVVVADSWRWLLAVLSGSFVLYLLGLQFVPLVLVVLLLARYLPYPAVIDSWLGRLFVAGVVTFGLLQIGASLQFLLLPETRFKTLTLVLLLLAAVICYLYGRAPRQKLPMFSQYDLVALGLSVLVLLPIAVLFLQFGGAYRAMSFGGMQSPDGVNHYMPITELQQSQHFVYADGAYYPKGFHIAQAYTQSSFGVDQASISWLSGTRLYIVQYLWWALGLLLALGYLVRYCLSVLGTTLSRVSQYAAMTAAIGLVGVLYVWQFIQQGFLNYFYTAIAYILALILLHSVWLLNRKRYDFVDTVSGSTLAMLLILVFAASMTWPLLLPPLVLGVLLYLADSGRYVQLIRALGRPRAWLILFLIVLQALPLYFQLRYGESGEALGLNIPGALTEFHYGVMLAVVVMMTWVLSRKALSQEFRSFVGRSFVPLFVLLIVVMGIQYFTAGEIRYYAVKTALLVEMIGVGVAAVLVVRILTDGSVIERMLLPTVLVGAALLLLLGLNTNPLGDARKMLSRVSGYDVPAHHYEDTTRFEQLGTTNQITRFNTIVVHQDPLTGKLTGNMQLSHWANAFGDKGVAADLVLQDCNGIIYRDLMYNVDLPSSNDTVIRDVTYCAKQAKSRGLEYFIVTDSASRPALERLFGEHARIYDQVTN